METEIRLMGVVDKKIASRFRHRDCHRSATGEIQKPELGVIGPSGIGINVVTSDCLPFEQYAPSSQDNGPCDTFPSFPTRQSVRKRFERLRRPGLGYEL
jgi:hypothetical protein